MSRDYKDEYNKFQSSDKKKKYRAKLNKYNKDKGTYGNGDGKDASHKDGKIVGFKDSSANKGTKEASRLKGSKRKKYKEGGDTTKSSAIEGIKGAMIGKKQVWDKKDIKEVVNYATKFASPKDIIRMMGVKKKGVNETERKVAKAEGGQVGDKTLHPFQPDPLEQFEFARPYEQGGPTNGGMAQGPSHDQGGIPGAVGPNRDPIEFEGGEFIVNKNKNDAAGKHEAKLKALNENPDDYEIVKKGEFEDGGFVYPTFDAKNRRQ